MIRRNKDKEIASIVAETDQSVSLEKSDQENKDITMFYPSKKRLIVIAIVYLLGLFIGALDTGIVTPARTIVQNGFGVDDAFGVWMITIYTLAYAVSIPIMGKLADMFGRKGIYLTSIVLFGVGSLLCGLSEYTNNFYVLLIARAIQAFGGGGIMPVATAELGTTFPPEKRGMALGLVGGVYGIANIFGASAGSLIIDIFGQENWAFIFYVNVPVCIAIVIAGLIALPKSKERSSAPIDILGILVLSCMTLSLLIGLKNIDFFDLQNSIANSDVYPYLIAALVLVFLFVFVESKAKDPVMNLSYFKNPRILITMVLSILTGVIMMGMIFIPQFSENAMRMPSGSGGYFVIILGLFAGLGAPMSGKLIDRFGVKLVLGIGFIASIAGCSYLAFVATSDPTLFNVVVSLVLIGIGVGFVMGTPLNYMMLENTDESESNSALATLSLVRSIGTAVAPALMVGFLVHAAATLPDQITYELPKQVTVSALPHAQEIQDKVNQYKSDEKTADMMADVDMPDLMSMQVIDIDMDMDGDSKYQIPDDLLAEMQDSDVTTIVSTTKHMASEMFAQMRPDLENDVEGGIDKGVEGVSNALSELQGSIDEMQSGIDKMQSGINEMDQAIKQQQQARKQMASMLPTMRDMEQKMKQMSAMGANGPNSSSAQGDAMKGQAVSSAATAQMPSQAVAQKVPENILDMMPSNVKDSIPASVQKSLADVKTSKDLENKIAELDSAISSMTASRNELVSSRDEMKNALEEMTASRDDLTTMRSQMEEMRAAVPASFDEAENNYLALIDERSEEIETTFQAALNEGFRGMFTLVAVCSVIGFVLVLFYRKKKEPND